MAEISRASKLGQVRIPLAHSRVLGDVTAFVPVDEEGKWQDAVGKHNAWAATMVSEAARLARVKTAEKQVTARVDEIFDIEIASITQSLPGCVYRAERALTELIHAIGPLPQDPAEHLLASEAQQEFGGNLESLSASEIRSIIMESFAEDTYGYTSGKGSLYDTIDAVERLASAMIPDRLAALAPFEHDGTITNATVKQYQASADRAVKILALLPEALDEVAKQEENLPGFTDSIIRRLADKMNFGPKRVKDHLEDAHGRSAEPVTREILLEEVIRRSKIIALTPDSALVLQRVFDVVDRTRQRLSS